jgi:hypothetical protein
VTRPLGLGGDPFAEGRTDGAGLTAQLPAAQGPPGPRDGAASGLTTGLA